MATGKRRYIWDLTAVRLASFNQTLDPWLYILLRRSLCVKIKMMYKRVLSIFSMNKAGNESKVQREQNKAECCQLQNDLQVFSRDKDLSVGAQSACQDSKPDLIDVINSEVVSQPQLPDVTTTEQGNVDCCVCQIHVDNYSLRGVPEEGIYVQFVIFSQNNHNGRSNVRSCYRPINRLCYRSIVNRPNNSTSPYGASQGPVVQMQSPSSNSGIDNENEKKNGGTICQNTRGDTKETLLTEVSKNTR